MLFFFCLLLLQALQRHLATLYDNCGCYSSFCLKLQFQQVLGETSSDTI